MSELWKLMVGLGITLAFTGETADGYSKGVGESMA